ncbi:hypothetical protein RUND412_007485, partial [Rhizina undulata]
RSYFAAVVPATLQPTPSTTTIDKQRYLQFWVSSSKELTRVSAAATATPSPYGIFSSWPDEINQSRDHGGYDTRMDLLLTSPTLPVTITNVIRFKEAFRSPPKVVVWLTGLSAHNGATVHVSTTANDVTETGFVLHMSSGDGDTLKSVGAAWAAWDEAHEGGYEGNPAVRVGSFSTTKLGSVRTRKWAETGSLLGRESKVFLSVCAVDLVLAGSLWMDMTMSEKSTYDRDKFKWNLKAGPVDARVYSARVAYVCW